jgi:hypothetical protein
MFNTHNSLKFFCASALIALSSQAQASLINIDITTGSNADKYNTGAGVFGTATSKWNELVRAGSFSNQALFDDTGASTSVTVSYTRLASGSVPTTGTFPALGASQVSTGYVSFSGLTAGGNYELAIFSSWDGKPSFSVGSATETITRNTTWSSLTEGVQYVLFQATADASGQLSFVPNANPTGTSYPASLWSAIQLQNAVTPVPVPASFGLFSLAMAGFGFAQRKAKKV